MDKFYPETPFANCSWYTSDIENALDLREYPYTNDNIKAVMNRIDPDALMEVMIEAGWDYIYARLDEASSAGELETYEDIEPSDDNLEMGFDPYLGCYTEDC